VVDALLARGLVAETLTDEMAPADTALNAAQRHRRHHRRDRRRNRRWQAHTVRGAYAGALKKRLGLEVTSEKVERPWPNLQAAGGTT
jgi:hypothetical protein